MSAPTKTRTFLTHATPPVGPAVARTEWFVGAAVNGRHAITYWRRGPNGKIPALCGITDVLWAAHSTSGDLCRVCIARLPER